MAHTNHPLPFFVCVRMTTLSFLTHTGWRCWCLHHVSFRSRWCLFAYTRTFTVKVSPSKARQRKQFVQVPRIVQKLGVCSRTYYLFSSALVRKPTDRSRFRFFIPVTSFANYLCVSETNLVVWCALMHQRFRSSIVITLRRPICFDNVMLYGCYVCVHTSTNCAFHFMCIGKINEWEIRVKNEQKLIVRKQRWTATGFCTYNSHNVTCYVVINQFAVGYESTEIFFCTSTLGPTVL